MTIEVLVQDSESGRTYDVSDNVTSVKWETYISSQPGKLSVEMIDDVNFNVSEGSAVRFSADGEAMFFGYVFTISPKDKGKKVELTCYDLMRYLKFKDTVIVRNETASDVFARICQVKGIPYSVVNPSSYVLQQRIHDNKTLYEVIEWGNDETLAYTGVWYIITANVDRIEFVNMESLKTGLVISNSSMGRDFSLTSSIDEDTYNQVKLTKDVETSGGSKVRQSYVVFDSSNVRKWGTLQMVDSADENMNDAQIAAKAETLLRLKNRPTKKISLKCEGDKRVKAGVGLYVDVEEIRKYGVDSLTYFFAESVTHSFSNGLHSMDITLMTA